MSLNNPVTVYARPPVRLRLSHAVTLASCSDRPAEDPGGESEGQDMSDGLTWYTLPAGQTYIGDAEILWRATGPATGTGYCKSRDGGIWAWSPELRKWSPVAAW